MARRHTVPWYWDPDYESCGYVKPIEDFISMACVAAGDPPHLPWNAPNSPAKWHEPFIEFMRWYDLVSVLDHGEAGCWMKLDNFPQQDFLTLPLGVKPVKRQPAAQRMIRTESSRFCRSTGAYGKMCFPAVDTSLLRRISSPAETGLAPS